MAEPIKITEEEVKELRDLQEKFRQNIMDFGTLYLERMQLDEAVKELTSKENSHQENFKKLQKAENDLVQKFLTKYGEGALNLKDATFIPEQKPV